MFVSTEISDTKLHTVLLNQKEIKLSWLVDWHKKEVMFNVDNPFNEEYNWFSIGFSQRGKNAHSDLCYFFKNTKTAVVKHKDRII